MSKEGREGTDACDKMTGEVGRILHDGERE